MHDLKYRSSASPASEEVDSGKTTPIGCFPLFSGLQEHILCTDENDSVVPCDVATLIDTFLLQVMRIVLR
ncbi:hypothetical protein ACHAXM_004032, partial [Skeletonema potamos]